MENTKQNRMLVKAAFMLGAEYEFDVHVNNRSTSPVPYPSIAQIEEYIEENKDLFVEFK